ncbi:MAG: ComEA family DNA-binding protein [Halorhodospira sp.]
MVALTGHACSIEELQAIPHIGPERAEAIVAMRPIQRIEQLESVDGIGPSRLAEIADQVKV